MSNTHTMLSFPSVIMNFRILTLSCFFMISSVDFKWHFNHEYTASKTREREWLLIKDDIFIE